MKLGKNFWISSSILSLFAYGAGATVIAEGNEWQPRSVEDVLEDLVIDEENQVTYTVKEGDTLGVISEAMKIEVHYLADINGISNIDLILPGTQLVAQLNQNQEAISLSVIDPIGNKADVALPVNLSPMENKLTETEEVEIPETPVVETTSAAIEEVPVSEVSETKVTEELKLVSTMSQATSVASTFTVQSAPVVEAAAAPVVETTVAPVVETTAAPVVETTVASVVETTAAPVVQTTVAPVERNIAQAVSKPENAGLQPHVAEFKERVGAQFGVENYSLYRAGDPQDHGKGLAVDFMVPVGSKQGDDIANYSVNNMAQNNISYVIWKQQINLGNGWQGMEDRGSVTANHYDHVHVSFNP